MKNLYLVNEVELTYKGSNPSIKIDSVETTVNVLRNNWSDDIELRESFNILLLSRANKVLGIVNISKGGVAGTVVDAKLIFSAALKGLASAIVLCHNHPSGNLNPSKSDIALTRKIVAGAKLLDVVVFDHIILTKESYFSFAEEGMI